MKQQQVVKSKEVNEEKEKKQSRFSKGVVLAATRRIIKVHNEDAWLVESETTNDKFYKVTVNGDGMSCECPDSQFRNNVCKHAYALIRRTIA